METPISNDSFRRGSIFLIQSQSSSCRTSPSLITSALLPSVEGIRTKRSPPSPYPFTASNVLNPPLAHPPRTPPISVNTHASVVTAAPTFHSTPSNASIIPLANISSPIMAGYYMLIFVHITLLPSSTPSPPPPSTSLTFPFLRVCLPWVRRHVGPPDDLDCTILLIDEDVAFLCRVNDNLNGHCHSWSHHPLAPPLACRIT